MFSHLRVHLNATIVFQKYIVFHKYTFQPIVWNGSLCFQPLSLTDANKQMFLGLIAFFAYCLWTVHEAF